MGRARRWAGEVTCDTVMTGELSAVACAAKESTNCQRCIPLVGLRQRHRLAVHHTAADGCAPVRQPLGYTLTVPQSVTLQLPSINSKAL